MTIAGIITMLLSIGAAWALLICCGRRLIKKQQMPPQTPKKR